MVYYFIKVIILLLISFSFSPFVFLWDAARERKRNLHTQGDGSKNFESEGPHPPILRLKWFLRGQLENCSGRGGTPSISSSQKRAETWHVLSAWPSGKHTHFRAERNGVGSLALTLTSWVTSASFLFLYWLIWKLRENYTFFTWWWVQMRCFMQKYLIKCKVL